MSKQPPFDPYALFAALDRERIGYVVIGGFARVVHGSAEITDGLDIVPVAAPRERPPSRPRARRARRRRTCARRPPRIGRTGDGADAGGRAAARAGAVGDARLRRPAHPANRDNLGRGARPAVASVVDCVRMLDASDRGPDAERLVRLRRVMELERQLVPRRGLYIER